MYVRNGARIADAIRDDRWSVVGLVVLAIATELTEPYLRKTELFSGVYLGVLSAALSIFLVFRFNEAYERWWEARKLWGKLVNLSRDFARQSLTLLPDAGESEKATLVYRQVAFVHALRVRLRQGASAQARASLEPILRRLLPEEAGDLLDLGNIPNALLCSQSQHLAELLRGSTASSVLLARFDNTLSGLHDVQGGCERIKTTAFPDLVTLITRLLVWGLILLLLLATAGPETRVSIFATAGVCFMGVVYIWIDSMARTLCDPFEGLPNDTPMDALSITIERDLREMRGETDLPEPVQPTNGVLM